MSDPTADAGKLPPWTVKELPAPPAFTFKNVLAVIGPGTIALSMSIGTGEWILGPMVTVKYGFSLMWIVLLGIVFQLFMNLEFIRYTVYTGEPTVNGFMRTKPGPAFWAVIYILLALCQLGWPAWAKGSAAVIFAMAKGRLPEAADSTALYVMGVIPFLVTILVVSVGGKTERMLEIVNKFMVIFVLGFLVTMCVWIVPGHIWAEAFLGHFKFLSIPETADFVLLAGFAGFAANGGIGNVMTSNWIRDKGYGMGSVVGYISTAIGGRKVNVSPVGSVFEMTPENLSRWRTWWKYLHVDQTVVWAVGCFLGMYLNVMLAKAIIPAGEELKGFQVGAFQAKFLAEHGGQILWYLTLLNGFWILFGSQLSIVDGFVRLTTDIFWSGSAKVREFAKGDIRKVYYTLLLVFAVWGCIAMQMEGGKLVKIASNAAAFILVIAGSHVLFLNRRFLPREIRAPVWLSVGVALGVVFYAFFSTMSVGQQLGLWGSPGAPGGGH